ncbi:MAG: DUF1844 domain-containing protein [Planctomycetota bacterium]|jgi:hypothetical protein
MSDHPEGQEKKIFVDEDWKSQVEAEKEAARHGQEPARPEPPPDSAGPLPPPNLTVLASSLYLQGMVALGLLPSPGSDKPEVHLDQAKHTVDTLQMLQDKTEGNRTPEESSEMDRMLHELRLAYVEVQQQEKAES